MLFFFFTGRFFFRLSMGAECRMVDLILSRIEFILPIASMGRLYIYLHEWLICMVNVGKCTSPMDAMGSDSF